MRLYLETEGKIKTLISEKDNFVRFHNEGTVSFLAPDASRLAPFPVRDPNITANDQGVYALTWDNRDPKIGPGDEFDDVLTSPTFGLAFSVDGLNWTVYSNEMTIEGLKRDVSRGVIATGAVRHVVPVFLTNEQIRLYFSYGIRTYTSGVPGGSSTSWSCSLGTAISN